nr:hypothetical protein [Leptolyngbya sp. FACHB-261]
MFSLIQEEIYFSGDGGLKALLAKQLSSGNLRLDLILPAETWVQQLWSKGLYPFKPPFVYHEANHYYITFPFTFPLLTAPFHALFGFRGLYIVPLVSLWSIWLSFYWTCQRLRLGNISSSIAVLVLIFASPLSLYGATYWEHTLAVALAFHGLSLLLVPTNQGLSKCSALLSGILIGLSAWFRPELLCVAGVLLALALACSRFSFLLNLSYLVGGGLLGLSIWLKDGAIGFAGLSCLLFQALPKTEFSLPRKKFLVASLVITIAVFFGLNTLIYHHPLGIHAIQVVEGFSVRTRLLEAYRFFGSMNSELMAYFPVIFFPLICVLLSLFEREVRLAPNVKLIALFCILTACLIPMLLPSDGGKQWGPRFLLILVPISTLVSVSILQSILQWRPSSLRYFSIGLFSMLVAVGIQTNTIQGAAYFAQNFKTAPLTQSLRQDSSPVIAVTHQYLNQMLMPVLISNAFFLTEDEAALAELGKALVQQKQQQFTYICYRETTCQASTGLSGFNLNGQQFSFQFAGVKKFEGHSVYKASIVQAGASS